MPPFLMGDGANGNIARALMGLNFRMTLGFFAILLIYQLIGRAQLPGPAGGPFTPPGNAV